MLTVIPLREEHLEDAAILVSQRYRCLYEQEAHLPYRYTEVTTLLPLLKEIFNASGDGVAAIRGNRLVGFLTSWQMPSFRGKKSTYSPEWANGAALEDSPRIYEELYSHLAADWVADGYVAHYISLFSNDIAAIKSWHWMGFGMVAIDAIRGLDPIPGCDVNVQIRRAEMLDLGVVIELQKALCQYSKGAPIFLLSENKERSYYEEWLGNPRKVVWLAYWKGEPVSFMRLGPANDDVSTIIVDEKTTSIYGAFTKEEVRKEGLATALLDRALEWARDSGYERCAVDFEPMNLLGSRFWLKYFNPVCSSVFRQIDDRMTQGVDSSTGRLSTGTGQSNNSANTHPNSPSLVWTWSQSPA